MDFSDAELIEAAREAPDAFGELFERHFDSVFRFCARRVGRGVAEDLAGETFRRAFEFRDRYQIDAEQLSALPWLLGIAMNLVKTELRSRAGLDLIHQRLASIAGTTPCDSVGDAVSGVDARADLVVVAQLLVDLPKEDVELLFLHVLDGLTYAEVAIAMDIPVGTVRSRLSRLRRRLQTLLVAASRVNGTRTGTGGT